MPRTLSPAQRANQITFVLKGHLKNAQIAYLRVAALLAKVRDERLYAALKHKTLEDYAAVRLGLGQASLYHYLQIYDWARKFHPGWLARKPKGFVPELTDAYALMWIDRHLMDEHLSEDLRRELMGLRAKALAGKLSLAEFQAFRSKIHGHTPPLRSVLAALRAARRRAAAPGAYGDLVAELDRLVDRVKGMLGTARRIGSPARLHRVRAPGRV